MKTINVSELKSGDVVKYGDRKETVISVSNFGYGLEVTTDFKGRTSSYHNKEETIEIVQQF